MSNEAELPPLSKASNEASTLGAYWVVIAERERQLRSAFSENKRMRELLEEVGMQVGSEYFDHTINKIETFLWNTPE